MAGKTKKQILASVAEIPGDRGKPVLLWKESFQDLGKPECLKELLGSSCPEKPIVVMAIGTVFLEIMASTPLTVCGVGPTGGRRTFHIPGVQINAPERENAKKLACQLIDRFFDDLKAVGPPRFGKPFGGFGILRDDAKIEGSLKENGGADQKHR